MNTKFQKNRDTLAESDNRDDIYTDLGDNQELPILQKVKNQ